MYISNFTIYWIYRHTLSAYIFNYTFIEYILRCRHTLSVYISNYTIYWIHIHTLSAYIGKCVAVRICMFYCGSILNWHSLQLVICLKSGLPSFLCIIQIHENIRRLSCIKKLKSRLVFKTNLEGIKMTNPISEIPKMKVLV